MQEGCINIAIYLSVPVTCRTQSTNTLLEVIMLKIYCCHRKDFQEQGLAVIELVYEYRMGRSIGPHWSWGANVWIIGTEDIIKYLRSLRKATGYLWLLDRYKNSGASKSGWLTTWKSLQDFELGCIVKWRGSGRKEILGRKREIGALEGRFRSLL